MTEIAEITLDELIAALEVLDIGDKVKISEDCICEGLAGECRDIPQCRICIANALEDKQGFLEVKEIWYDSKGKIIDIEIVNISDCSYRLEELKRDEEKNVQ